MSFPQGITKKTFTILHAKMIKNLAIFLRAKIAYPRDPQIYMNNP